MRSRTTRAALVTTVFALLAVSPPGGPTVTGTASAAPQDPVEQLQKDLDAILDKPGLADGQASVFVREADGAELYNRGKDERLMPASNTKLFTSAAALEVLGPDHRFPTSALADGRVSGGILRGDLYLRGRGDPTLLQKDYEDLAKQVRAKGITRVMGDLRADDTWFDSRRLGDSWSWDYEDAYYGAQISALTVSPNEDYDAGTVILDIAPGAAAGDRPSVGLTPQTSYVKIVNTATTTDGGEEDLFVARRHGTNIIDVKGTIPKGDDPFRIWVAVWEPAGYAADVFRRALTKAGVRVYGRTTIGTTPADAKEVGTHESMTVAQLMIPFMKLSNNGHAEVLTKEMGRKVAGEGSWDAGKAAARDALKGLGVQTDRLRFVDGSGLSRMNIVSAQQIMNLLTGARSEPWFDTWYDSLPVAGAQDRMVGGTLRNRMRGTAAENNVHAKTGTLTGATALSGYVKDKDGKVLLFSIVHNNHIEVNPKSIEDEIAIRLANFTRGEATPTVQRVGRTDYGPADAECSWVKAC